MNDTFDDARLLAQHSAALRRLARGLVSDPNTADDLVQETWLGALRRWRRRGEATGPGGLRLGVRHRAISAHRKRGAEAIGDTDSFAGSVGGPAETAATLERCRVLHEELGALREPYRSTLVLRFIEEQPHAAIARAQGIATDTVRTRITRGLTLLREQLDRRFDDGDGGGRGAWVAALGPLVRPERSAANVGAGALLAGAGVVAVTLAALASGDSTRGPLIESRSVAGAESAGGDIEPIGTGGRTPAPRVGDGATGRATAAAPAEDPVDASPDEPRPLTISGRVVDQFGAPIEGLDCTANPPPHLDMYGSLGRAVTDELGRFEIVLPPRSTMGSRANVIFGRAQLPRDVAPGEPWRTRRLGSLQLVRAGSSGHEAVVEISRREPGRVVGVVPELESKRTSEDRSVFVHLTTDVVDGEDLTRYAIDGLMPGDPYALEGIEPGRYSVRAGGSGKRPLMRSDLLVRSGATTEIEFHRHEDLAHVLVDRVEVTGGGPAPPKLRTWLTDGVGLAILGSASIRHGGPFELAPDGLAPGVWKLEILTDGYAFKPMTLRLEEASTEYMTLELRPTRALQIELRVPLNDDATSRPWGAIECVVLDSDEDIIARAPQLLVHDRRGVPGVETHLVEVPLPMGVKSTIVVRSDGGHEARLDVFEPDVHGETPTPIVDLR